MGRVGCQVEEERKRKEEWSWTINWWLAGEKVIIGCLISAIKLGKE